MPSTPGLPSLQLPSWQDLLALIPGFQAGSLAFDASDRTLTYRVQLDELLAQQVTTLDFGQAADLTPLTLTPGTLLADINGGRGVAASPTPTPACV